MWLETTILHITGCGSVMYQIVTVSSHRLFPNKFVMISKFGMHKVKSVHLVPNYASKQGFSFVFDVCIINKSNGFTCHL